MDLNLFTMGNKERWELYQIADDLGLFYKLPPQPKPLAQPLVHLYQIGGEKQLNPYLWSGRADLSEDEKRACMYAWHVWRERTDVWEVPQLGGQGYDPGWLRDGHTTFLLYDQFISAFELERYFVNPWVRAAAWVTSLDLTTIPEIATFELNKKGQGSNPRVRKPTKRSRVSNRFAEYVAEIPRWWVNQREMGNFGPVPELALPSAGYVSVALRDMEGSPQPDTLLEGNWHNGYGNRYVENQKATCFSWDEFMWRRDELEFVLPGVVNQMLAMGPKGASWGAGCRERAGKSEGHLWSMERKLLNRMFKRIDAARGFVGAIADVADSKKHR